MDALQESTLSLSVVHVGDSVDSVDSSDQSMGPSELTANEHSEDVSAPTSADPRDLDISPTHDDYFASLVSEPVGGLMIVISDVVDNETVNPPDQIADQSACSATEPQVDNVCLTPASPAASSDTNIVDATNNEANIETKIEAKAVDDLLTPEQLCQLTQEHEAAIELLAKTRQRLEETKDLLRSCERDTAAAQESLRGAERKERVVNETKERLIKDVDGWTKHVYAHREAYKRHMLESTQRVLIVNEQAETEARRLHGQIVTKIQEHDALHSGLIQVCMQTAFTEEKCDQLRSRRDGLVTLSAKESAEFPIPSERKKCAELVKSVLDIHCQMRQEERQLLQKQEEQDQQQPFLSSWWGLFAIGSFAILLTKP